MPTTKPDLEFDSNQVCSGCINFENRKNIDWDKREKELSALCDKHRKDDGTWDVIVPSSGGKDSSYVSYVLKEKYGMNPLTVTWAQQFQRILDKKIYSIWLIPDKIMFYLHQMELHIENFQGNL